MFTLSIDQLVDIAVKMARDVREGLRREGADILCIPTFIPLSRSPEPGRVLAIDVGGTNARCALVALEKGNRFSVKKGPIKTKIPVTRGIPLDRNTFLGTLEDILQQLAPPAGLPVGYCFSYPARPEPDGDAIILKWTKALFVRDSIGEKAGRMLRDYINRTDPGRMGSSIKVINDAVAALLAGLPDSKAGAHIGLIAGSGSNMAMLLPAAHIPKLTQPLRQSVSLPVNMESGNFHPPHLTRWDDALDAASDNPTQQRLEKAVSGVYLPYLFKMARPESEVNPELGSAALFQKAFAEPSPPDEKSAAEAEIALQLIQRSASLIAAALAGAISILVNATAADRVTITAEGGLFHAHPRYRAITTATLETLLSSMGMAEIHAEIQTVTDANLKGCAMAGLAKPPGSSCRVST
ncbi:MAG: hypothetical protein SWH68_14340 [Thermodesulfobacteriota bacterium]|nr:hypothetical protein [Thermodesulfobacteriota bacterium]